MGAIVWVGFLAFFVVSLVVGVRLLILARRTGEAPELLIGIGVLGIGPVGFGSMTVAQAVIAENPELGHTLFALASLTLAVGIFCKGLFNWRVYHPGSEVAGGLVTGVGLFLVGQYVYRAGVVGFVPVSPPDGLTLAHSVVQVGALLWGAGEAIRYWLMMRKRARIGLADPVVTNRFLMWGIGAGAAGVGTAVGVTASMVTGLATLETPWVIASSSAHGFVAAVALSLAFVPPKAYLRWVSGRAEGQGA